jgi:hypothetical protein
MSVIEVNNNKPILHFLTYIDSDARNSVSRTVPQKLNVNLFFDIEFFKYFFRVLHEASSPWLKLFRVFRLHPV